MNYFQKSMRNLVKQYGISPYQVETVINLLKEGSTVPFISRYRKALTCGLTEDIVRSIEEVYTEFIELNSRKKEIIKLLSEEGMLTDEVESEILSAGSSTVLDNIYRPYKNKELTRGAQSKKLGLEGLAKKMLELPSVNANRNDIIDPYVNDIVQTRKDAVCGAKNIVAEIVAFNQEYRRHIRENTIERCYIISRKKQDVDDQGEKFKLYYDYKQRISNIKTHILLALNRGEERGILDVSVEMDDDHNIEYLNHNVVRSHSLFGDEIRDAIKDGYYRLMKGSIGREIRNLLSESAHERSIKVFRINLKNLLLQPPLKEKCIMGVDPAFVSGCKLAVVDKIGKFVFKDVIYPHPTKKGSSPDPDSIRESEEKILRICSKYKVNVIAIGNGTASRETETFIANTIKKFRLRASYIIVSEDGASVYSASNMAREEFPDLEVQERSAISIARRIQDPLSELVKIDPKSLGIGQYQHDVDERKLSRSLDNVVVDTVNQVGVNINTASVPLLSYVSGLDKEIASVIVKMRENKGKFKNREQLKSIKQITPKVYEQSIGFLRIFDGDNHLDKTFIHPESYTTAEKLMDIIHVDSNDIGSERMKKAIDNVDQQNLSKELDVDEYTLKGICDALVAPLRDIRENYPTPILRKDILNFEDIKVGDEMSGTVRNVTDFGCFVDVGVKVSGLLHKSQIGVDLEYPSDVLSVGDLVDVRVISIDIPNNKLGLKLLQKSETSTSSVLNESLSSSLVSASRSVEQHNKGRRRYSNITENLSCII